MPTNSPTPEPDPTSLARHHSLSSEPDLTGFTRCQLPPPRQATTSTDMIWRHSYQSPVPMHDTCSCHPKQNRQHQMAPFYTVTQLMPATNTKMMIAPQPSSAKSHGTYVPPTAYLQCLQSCPHGLTKSNLHMVLQEWFCRMDDTGLMDALAFS